MPLSCNGRYSYVQKRAGTDTFAGPYNVSGHDKVSWQKTVAYLEIRQWGGGGGGLKGAPLSNPVGALKR